jgi:hypothetical protein
MAMVMACGRIIYIYIHECVYIYSTSLTTSRKANIAAVFDGSVKRYPQAGFVLFSLAFFPFFNGGLRPFAAHFPKFNWIPVSWYSLHDLQADDVSVFPLPLSGR